MNSNFCCCLEFAFSSPGVTAAGFDWPTSPGSAIYTGDCSILHVAPNRWVLMNPTPATITRLQSLADVVRGIIVDISGKWRVFDLPEADAARILCAAAPIDRILRGRDCASVVLFDCPALVARSGKSFHVWIQSSYATSFAATYESVANRLAAQ